MSTVKEIKAAIAALPVTERAKLDAWMLSRAEEKPGSVIVPDQAARRRSIYGKMVLPNMVLLERESKSL